MRIASRIGKYVPGAWAVLLVLLFYPQSGIACLANYHSPDWLAAESPLILIGRVETVEKGVAMKTTRRGFRWGEQQGEPGPTTACAGPSRVARCLHATNGHGRFWSNRVLRPLPNVHYTFPVGEELLFLLPALPDKGNVALRYGGSLLPVCKTEMIESRLARARQYQAAYLTGIERDMPQVYVAASKLAERARQTCMNWPQLTRVPVKTRPDCFTDEEGEVFKIAKKKLIGELAKLDVEAIRTAIAMDWLSDDLKWSKHPLWEKAVEELVQSRSRDVVAADRAAVRRELVAAGVGKDCIDHYLSDIRDNDGWSSLRFPMYGPHSYQQRSPENLTTDFILRFHRYDRGNMFRDYGMNFDVLAKLDPARVKTIIPTLYGSDDGQLKIVACRVIEQLPGTAFVGLIVAAIRDDCYAWWHLVSKDEKDTSRRLTAMLNQAEHGVSVWGRMMFSRNFPECTKCFSGSCVFREQ